MKTIPAIRDRTIEEGGFYHQLNDNAICYFHRGTEHLVITFDDLTLAGKQQTRDKAWGEDFLRKHGFSNLAVLAGRRDWYGQPDLEVYLSELARSGFFTPFKKVTFYGVSMGAFAALVFSRLVPGCIVVAYSPQTTLDQDVIPTETRWPVGTSIGNWKTRTFADATVGLETAGTVYIITDPFDEHERRHAERFPQLDQVKILHLWHSGHFILSRFRAWGMSNAMVLPMLAGDMTKSDYYKLLRKRRERNQWYRLILRILLERGHKNLADLLTKWAEKNTDIPDPKAHTNKLSRAIKADKKKINLKPN